MITREPDGTVTITSDDWTPVQMALGALIDRLPGRPDEEDSWVAAIERLGDGGLRPFLSKICDAIGELDYRPTEFELLQMVEAIRTVQSDLAALRHRGFPRIERPRPI